MSAFSGSSSPFLSLTRPNHFSASSQTPLPNPPNLPSQPNSPTPLEQLSATSSSEQNKPLSVKVEQQQKPPKSSAKADSTDWIASTLTRRFGLGAGLAWATFLAVGIVSEQVKTRLEVSEQEANTRNVDKQEEAVLSNGIRYCDLRVGGGATPRPGDLVVIELKGEVVDTGKVFVNTIENDKKRPLALVIGSRPYSKGLCEGIEYVLRSMKAGGKRRVIIPPNLAFGENGADLGPGLQVPPNATLEYVIEIERVSIAPA